MAKSRNGKDEEYYKGEIRRLLKQNRELKKRLRVLEKSKHMYQQLKLDEEVNEELTNEAIPTACQVCNEGDLVGSDMAIGILITCTNCKYRKFVKK